MLLILIQIAPKNPVFSTIKIIPPRNTISLEVNQHSLLSLALCEFATDTVTVVGAGLGHADVQT